MLYVEVNVPQGCLPLAERRRLATMLTAEGLLDDGGGVNPGVLALYQSLTHVVVRENDVWVAGGRLAVTAGRPRYLVTVHAGDWAKDLAGHLVAAITRRIEAFDGDPDAMRFGGRCLVYVVGVPDGRYGAYGEVLTTEGFAELADDARTGAPDHVPEDMAGRRPVALLA